MPFNENKLTSVIKELLGSQEGMLFLTSSGAEATTQVLFSHYWEEARLQGKNQFITQETFLEELSCVVKKPQSDLAALLSPRTALVSLEIADPLSGVVQPIEAIALLCEQKGISLHVDVTEALGAMPLNIMADYISFDAKTLGVKGAGALLAKKPLRPLIYGQRFFNEAVLESFLEKAEKALQDVSFVGLEIARLRKRFEKRVKEEISGCRIIGEEQLRLPHKSYLSFEKVHPNALAFRLQESGYTCREGEEGISFTFAPSTNAAFIEALTEQLINDVAFLRQVSEGL